MASERMLTRKRERAKGETLNPIKVFNAVPPPACHCHPMELPETLFISVLGSTIFFLIFSFSSFSFFFLVFKKKIGANDLDLGRVSPMMSIKGPYQYKNRGQNFLLTGRAAS